MSTYSQPYKVVRYYVSPCNCTICGHWQVFQVISDGSAEGEIRGRLVGDYPTRKEAQTAKDRLNAELIREAK